MYIYTYYTCILYTYMYIYTFIYETYDKMLTIFRV